MAKDPIKKAENGTYYFRANLGFHPITGKQIQKYKSGFKTKKEAREAYSKLMLTSTEELTEKKQQLSFQQFIEETYLPWYKTQVKESTYLNRRLLWSSIFVTLMANKIGGLQFGIYRNCQISSRVFHTAVAALPLTKANRSDFE